MFKESLVQEALKNSFPQFSSKPKLIDYYVSFDFPEKQMKMVGWWQKIIEFIIQLEHKTYITYQQLVSYVSFYNLKPTPLPAIINFLAKREVLVPENQIANQQLNQQQSNKPTKSWFNSLLPFLSKPEKEKSIFIFVPTEKIFSKKIKEFKKNEIKNQLSSIFNEQVKSIDEFKLIKQLEVRINLDVISIKEILKELHFEFSISVEQRGQKEFVLYSFNQKDLFNKEWKDLESMKFYLREEINKFEFMISKEEEKSSKLREKAREQAENSNIKGAKSTVKEIVQKQKKVMNISTRKNLLENQITQLQYNEMNKSTILLLEEAQKIYQQTMIDSNRLDQVMEKNEEQQAISKQTNIKLGQMASQEENEEEVEEMFERLNREVQENKQNVVQKKSVKVEINQEEPMDIEHPKEIEMN